MSKPSPLARAATALKEAFYYRSLGRHDAAAKAFVECAVAFAEHLRSAPIPCLNPLSGVTAPSAPPMPLNFADEQSDEELSRAIEVECRDADPTWPVILNGLRERQRREREKLLTTRAGDKLAFDALRDDNEKLRENVRELRSQLSAARPFIVSITEIPTGWGARARGLMGTLDAALIRTEPEPNDLHAAHKLATDALKKKGAL